MKTIKPSYEIIGTLNETEILKKSSYVAGCKTCRHNKERTVRSKNCLKNHRAVFGCNCKDYSELRLKPQTQLKDGGNKQ